ncbi:hypothetical protein [Paenibacillus sp. PL2-23]|uniref:hypothetical protein n=1 Tax=Paenibacillus sp. PL2-23 TaxID=2100729 RepID=UPI0030FB2056
MSIPHTQLEQENTCLRQRMLALFLLFPLLITALFAYQAGNNFELTANARKSQTRPIQVYFHVDKHPAETKALLPNSPNVAAAAASLLGIYALRLPIVYLYAHHFTLLLRSILRTIQFSGRFVDEGRSSLGKLRRV